MDLEPTPSLPLPNPENAERRVHTRQSIRSLSYVDLGPGNGGVVLNLSEGGLAVSLAMEIATDELSDLTFRLPGKGKEIEIGTRVIWTGKSRKELGLRFERIRDKDAQRIRAWISAQQEGLESIEAVRPVVQNLPSPSDERPDETQGLFPDLNEAAEPKSVSQATTLPDAGESTVLTLNDVHQLFVKPPGAIYHRRSSLLLGVAVLFAFGTGLFVDHQLRKDRATSALSKGTTEPSIAPGGDAPPQSVAEGVFAPSSPASDPLQATNKINANEAVPQPAQKSQDRQENLLHASPANVHYRNAEKSESKQRTESASAEADSESNGESKSPEKGFGSITQQLAEVERATSEAAAKTVLEQNSESETVPSLPLTKAAAGLDSDINSKSGSVTIQMPPAPSLRIPPDIQVQTSPDGPSAQIGQLLSRVQPVYPPEALNQQLQGTVRAHLTIGRDGSVENVQVEGEPLLAQASAVALREWRFQPSSLNGAAVGAEISVTIVFQLSAASPQ